MHKISTSVKRDDSKIKSSGQIKYISDIEMPEILQMSVLSSDVQHGRIKKIIKPELPHGYYIIDGSNFKGMNRATIVAQDWPFFAEDEVLYYGQPLLAVTGKDLEVCEKLCSEVKVEYDILPAVSVIEEAEEFFNDYTIVRGDPVAAFKNADNTFENSYRTGIQEQAYMEPQGMIASFEDGIITVQGSMQCPYYIKNSLMNAFNLDADHVRVIQAPTGGAFGGKEDYPSVLAGQAAAAAMVTGKPVKIVLDRRNDMIVTPQTSIRH